MPRCQGCRFNFPGSLARCPACGASQLAPDLAARPGEGLPAGSLAPSLASGPRLPAGTDLARAIAEAAPFGVIELDAGHYRLLRPLTIDKALVINGVGLGQTTIASMAADFVLHVIGGGRVTLRGLTVAHEGKTPADVLVVAAADVELDDVRVTGGYTAGFARAASGAGRHGRGLVLTREASAIARGCRFDHNLRDGVALLDDASAALTGGAIASNQGAGLLVAGRAHGSLQDVAITHNYLAGVMARDDGRVVLRGVRCTRGGGFGVAAVQRAVAAIASSVLDDNARSGLAVWDAAQAAVAATSCSRNQEHGLDAKGDAQVAIDGLTARDNRGHGLALADRAGGRGRGVEAAGNGLGDTRRYDGATLTLDP